MLAYIYRLIVNFEQEHGVAPNTIYLSRTHCEHLQAGFHASYSIGQIMETLQMGMIIDSGAIHPHVAWCPATQRAAS